MKIKDKITSIRRALTELETLLQLNESLTDHAGDTADKIYAIIEKCQPIHKRGITRKSYWISGAERNRIISELCYKQKIIAIKQGKRIVFITQDHPSKAFTY